MFLAKQAFSDLIRNGPLVSIDLVVKNSQNQALLGRRLNRPAQGFWFVPGGRILKDEPMADAFKRLTKEELGQTFSIEQASLLGPYDHFYHDNVFDDTFSTHYVAIAFILNVQADLSELPHDVQHAGYKWFDIDQLKQDSLVHKHTRNYFS